MPSTIAYERAQPTNQAHLAAILHCERIGFGKGIDPVELPEVLPFIARTGTVWLQYAEPTETERKATGVLEFLPLDASLAQWPEERERLASRDVDVSESSLGTILADHERTFADVRRFTGLPDSDIVYHHGISMAEQGKGYGRKLLTHGLSRINSEKAVVCYIDAAQFNPETGTLEPAPNERSYTLHMGHKGRFMLVGFVDPPVYEGTITHYAMVRPPQGLLKCFVEEPEEVRFDVPNVSDTIGQVHELTKAGFVGVNYDHETHTMTFRQVQK